MDINKLRCDISGLSETSPSSDIEMLHHVPSWALFTISCSTQGGGVLLYVRDPLKANKLVNFSVIHEHLEAIFVHFSVSEINYVIGNAYRPPNSNIDELLSELSNIRKMALTDFPKSIFYIMGDFNYVLFWINSNSRCMESYLLFTSLGIFPTISRPTRVSSNSKNSIENVWTNNIGPVTKSGVFLSGMSDHFTIFIIQYLTKELLDTHVTFKVRSRSRACYDKFRVLLCEVNWGGICNQMKADVICLTQLISL